MERGLVLSALGDEGGACAEGSGNATFVTKL
jgi:hypothetical protein